MKIETLEVSAINKKLAEKIECSKWRSIFAQNIITDKGAPQWKCNMEDLYKNTKKFVPEVAYWGSSYGLWPGQTLALFAAHSRWVHLSTNTL